MTSVRGKKSLVRQRPYSARDLLLGIALLNHTGLKVVERR
jgi:hypothetical protein